MFGKLRKPKQVYLQCPFCGNQQMEPLMAISSYCRECGEYFRIEKGEPIVKSGPRISGVSEVLERRNPTEKVEPDAVESDKKSSESEEAPTVDAWLRSPGIDRQDKAQALTQPTPEPGDLEETEGVGGAFFGLVEEEKPKKKKASKKNDKSPADDKGADSEESIGKGSQSKGTLAQGSMSAMIGDIAESNKFGADKSRMPTNFVPPDQQKRKQKSKKNSKQIEVRCFRCNHLQPVSRYAASTQCGRCSVYITMSDYEIKGARQNVLRTRGNVLLTRRGSVVNTELACQNFTSYGLVSAKLDCTGEVIFKHSGKVTGKIYCRHLLVAKKCEVEFTDGVVAESADIYGKVRGNVTCKDSITVRKTGVIAGDARANQVKVLGGGMISGETVIDQDVDITIPVKSGYNPSMIS